MVARQELVCDVDRIEGAAGCFYAHMRAHLRLAIVQQRQQQQDGLDDTLDREALVPIPCPVLLAIAAEHAYAEVGGVSLCQFRNVCGDVPLRGEWLALFQQSL